MGKKNEAVVANKYEEQFEELIESISDDYDELIDKMECIACIKGEIEYERGSITALEWAVLNAEYYLRRGEYREGLIRLIDEMNIWVRESHEDIDKFYKEIKTIKEYE